MVRRNRSLAGQEIAITGRLASMRREQAVEWIEARGGSYATCPTESTAKLVVGEEGWPLRADGQPTRSLRRAHALQRAGRPIEIVTESDFVSALGLEPRPWDARGSFSIEQLGRMLDVPVARVRGWIRQGLLRPARAVRRLCAFDFRQVARAKALNRLLESGVSPSRIRRSLEQLGRWMPGAEDSLTQLEAHENGAAILARTDDGRIVEPSGQLRFDFEDDDGEPAPDLRRLGIRDARTWFEIGVREEDDGEFEAAAKAYQNALLAGGPMPSIAFNLGNVLHSLGRPAEAAQRYLQAVEQSAEYIEAWNNLGIVLSELGRNDDALDAYERALAIAPNYADAHFNLAETLEHLGRSDAARPHWEAYLREDPDSFEATHAARRLGEHRE